MNSHGQEEACRCTQLLVFHTMIKPVLQAELSSPCPEGPLSCMRYSTQEFCMKASVEAAVGKLLDQKLAWDHGTKPAVSKAEVLQSCIN